MDDRVTLVGYHDVFCATCLNGAGCQAKAGRVTLFPCFEHVSILPVLGLPSQRRHGWDARRKQGPRARVAAAQKHRSCLQGQRSKAQANKNRMSRGMGPSRLTPPDRKAVIPLLRTMMTPESKMIRGPRRSLIWARCLPINRTGMIATASQTLNSFSCGASRGTFGCTIQRSRVKRHSKSSASRIVRPGLVSTPSRWA